MKCLLFFIFCLSFQCAIYAQSGDIASKEPWRVERVISNNFRRDGSFSKAVATFKDGKVALAMRYPKAQWGVAMMDATGKILWEIPAKGYILAISKMDDKVVVFYTPDWKGVYDEHVITKIVGVIIAADKGIVEAEKEILQNATNNFIDVKIATTPDESLSYLLLRYTNYKGKRFFAGNWKNANLKSTDKIEILTVKKDLVTATQVINSKAISGLFLSCNMMPDGALALISRDENSLTAEKFKYGQAEPLAQLSVEASFTNKSIPVVFSSIDPANPDRLYISLHCKNEKGKEAIKLYGIDWKEKKILAQEITLNSDFKETLEKQNGDLSRDIRKHIDDIFPIGIYVSNGKVILISQVYYEVSFDKYYNSYFADLVISVYNGQLSNEGNVVLRRDYVASSGNETNVGVEADGNILHVTHSGLAKVSTFYCDVNLSTLKVDKVTPVSNRRLMPGEKEYVPGDALIYYYGDVLNPYYINRTQVSKSWLEVVRRMRD